MPTQNPIHLNRALADVRHSADTFIDSLLMDLGRNAMWSEYHDRQLDDDSVTDHDWTDRYMRLRDEARDLIAQIEALQSISQHALSLQDDIGTDTVPF